MTSLTRLGWREDVLRRKLCFDSRKRRNVSSAKSAKRQKRQSKKDWRKRCEKNRKRRRQGEKRKNAREIWYID